MLSNRVRIDICVECSVCLECDICGVCMCGICGSVWRWRVMFVSVLLGSFEEQAVWYVCID